MTISKIASWQKATLYNINRHRSLRKSTPAMMAITYIISSDHNNFPINIRKGSKIDYN